MVICCKASVVLYKGCGNTPNGKQPPQINQVYMKSKTMLPTHANKACDMKVRKYGKNSYLYYSTFTYVKYIIMFFQITIFIRVTEYIPHFLMCLGVFITGLVSCNLG